MSEIRRGLAPKCRNGAAPFLEGAPGTRAPAGQLVRSLRSLSDGLAVFLLNYVPRMTELTDSIDRVVPLLTYFNAESPT
jgi:hypothetical protein